MNSFDQLSLKELVNEVSNGSLLGIPADYSGVPMHFTKALIKKGVKDLKLYCLPLTTIQGDFLLTCHLELLLKVGNTASNF
jgi:glutaconate CoA-transferase subunit A